MSSDEKVTTISGKLLEEISASLQNIKGWGSIEIFIQNYQVTQVIEKNIKKPSIAIRPDNTILER